MEPGYGRSRLGPGKDQDLDQELDNRIKNVMMTYLHGVWSVKKHNISLKKNSINY